MMFRGLVLTDGRASSHGKIRFPVLDSDSQEIYTLVVGDVLAKKLHSRKYVCLTSCDVSSKTLVIHPGKTTKIFQGEEFVADEKKIEEYLKASHRSIRQALKSEPMQRMSVCGRVSKRFAVQTNQPDSPSKWRRLDVVIGDGDSQVKVKLWNEAIEMLPDHSEEESVIFENVKAEIYNDQFALSSTDETSIKIKKLEALEVVVRVEGLDEEDNVILTKVGGISQTLSYNPGMKLMVGNTYTVEVTDGTITKLKNAEEEEEEEEEEDD